MSNEIDPMGLLRAENAALREELAKAGAMLKELVGRCKGQDTIIENMAGHMAILLEKNGGSVVITQADREMAAERVVQGYRTEDIEDGRQRWFTMTPEEYEEQRRKAEAADQAHRDTGVDPDAPGPGLRIIQP